MEKRSVLLALLLVQVFVSSNNTTAFSIVDVVHVPTRRPFQALLFFMFRFCSFFF